MLCPLFLGDDLKAKRMSEKVRVLCWVMTAPENHDKKAKHVKATWGKRCNILLFMSTAEGIKTIYNCLPCFVKLSIEKELPTHVMFLLQIKISRL